MIKKNSILSSPIQLCINELLYQYNKCRESLRLLSISYSLLRGANVLIVNTNIPTLTHVSKKIPHFYVVGKCHAMKLYFVIEIFIQFLTR